MDKIISIMMQSFTEEFYVDKSKVDKNNLYLKKLTEKVIAIYDGQNDSLENIANSIWCLDIQIGKMMMPQLNVLVPYLVLMGVVWDDIFEQNYSWLSDLNSDEKEEFAFEFEIISYINIDTGYKIWRILKSFDKLKQNDKQLIIDCLDKLCPKWIEDESMPVWNFKSIKNIERCFPQINLILWVAEIKKKIVNHQDVQFIVLYEWYDKRAMYRSMFDDSAFEGRWDTSIDVLNNILKNAYGITLYHGGDIYEDIDSVIVDWIRESNENAGVLLKTSMQYSAIIRKLIVNSITSFDESLKQYGLYREVINKYHKEKSRMETYISNLEQINCKLEKKICKLENDICKIRNKNEIELISLRNYLFHSQNETNNFSLDIDEQVFNYDGVAIVGGHIRWQAKMQQELDGITVIAADLSNLDLSFLKKMRLIVFMVGYLSHSMYYRVLDNLNGNQKIIYIKMRNINQIKEEINKALTETS